MQPARNISRERKLVEEIMAPAGITLDGPNPWDPQIHDETVFKRVFRDGSIAIGESYVDGQWDVEDMAECVARILGSESRTKLYSLITVRAALNFLRHRIMNLQNVKRAFHVGEKHYDIGNDLYERMLGKSLTYSCGFWKDATTLDEAQEAKLDLVCKKIGLKKGDRVLDIGCGWGSFAIFAAQKYGAHVIGITISKEQAAYAMERAKGLPVEIRVQDYRTVSDGPYDHVVSIGMFEHVGPRNYRVYMQTVKKLLKSDGLFLLHTIGNNRIVYVAQPWVERYIFPNFYIPAPAHIGKSINGLFVLEDWHNFGADYEKTLLAWFENFDKAWPDLKEKYDEHFYRMWKFYLLSCAGASRSRYSGLWQIVLSPQGVVGGYQSVR